MPVLRDGLDSLSFHGREEGEGEKMLGRSTEIENYLYGKLYLGGIVACYCITFYEPGLLMYKVTAILPWPRA